MLNLASFVQMTLSEIADVKDFFSAKYRFAFVFFISSIFGFQAIG